MEDMAQSEPRGQKRQRVDGTRGEQPPSRGNNIETSSSLLALSTQRFPPRLMTELHLGRT